MNKEIIIFVLCICLGMAVFIIIYQQFIFRIGIQKKVKSMNQKLTEIIDTNSDEKVMIFTDNKIIIELASQINRLLEERQKMKADFKRYEISSKKMLSNISHDIKTPLTVILGYLEIMGLKDKENEMLNHVEQKAKQVMDLINEFFTLAKIESGDMDMNINKVSISEIWRESILDFYQILEQKDFQVKIEIPQNEIFVLGNKEAIQRILSNLISNAVRYGSEGKYIGLSLYTNERDVYIDISDRGKGIEKSNACYVFDRLYTQEDSRNYKIQGNGLGLTIAKNLAISMGGDIMLDSTPNVKTTFTVKLNGFTF
jgi:signal transduction histidine kinase